MSGPERLSYRDAARILTSVLGRTINYTPLTFAQQQQALVNAGMPEALASMNTQALELFAQGDSDWITDEARAVVGAPPRTFEKFATDHAPAFDPPLAVAS